MPADVFIQTTARNALQYWVDPVLGFLQRSLREQQKTLHLLCLHPAWPGSQRIRLRHTQCPRLRAYGHKRRRVRSRQTCAQ
jgi:hypothetical protein